MNNARSHGFTLIELMVTIVILAIIVGIAYPSYQNYTVQTRRSDAQVALTQTANRLEKYFSVCNSYPTAGATAGLTNAWPAAVANCPPGTGGIAAATTGSPDGHYTLALDTSNTIAGACSAAGVCYMVTATPTAGGLQVGNGALRIDSTGRKQWNKPGSGWVSWTKK